MMMDKLRDAGWQELYDEYGDRPIDIRLSMSQNLINRELDGVKTTGLTFDKKGNFVFSFNIAVKLIVKIKEEKRSE